MPCSNPEVVAELLDTIRAEGASGQVAALLHRDPATHVRADSLYAMNHLAAESRPAGAHEQAAVLVGRLPGTGMFEPFRAQRDREDLFRFGREADGSPARPWSWDDLN